mmetsp:Transcript_2732/g.4057  ORF Transcript_2732/g.4057 Transcript_2732/m.4057 type:complete len:579 (-) Transcript_2732:400-2136(-)
MSYSSFLEDEDHRCRHCQSQSLRVDWAQGDRVCTNCGVVDGQHVMDDRPEWKDFNDAEDIVKGLPSGSRCGLVKLDDQKYPGGLQPTSISKQVFGTPFEGSSAIRRTLDLTNKKLDKLVSKERTNALKRARISRLIQKKMNERDEDESIRPEHDELVLQEEEDAQRAYEALHVEKWSLDRAILLHGTDDEQNVPDVISNREELSSQLTQPLKRAASDLYKAYYILQKASQRLKLPIRIIQDATNALCQYAARKDGLSVKGVSSRLSSAHSSKEACEKLRQYNKHKQMASLASALLFFESRKHGQHRPMQDICKGFDGPSSSSKEEDFIKLKHTSKAMKELRALFPEYKRATTTLPEDSLVEYVTRKLQLPPVATASIEVLVQTLKEREDRLKLPTLCAAVILFVTTTGAVMQRLAEQAAAYGSSQLPEKGIKENAMDSKKASFDLFSHDPIAEDRAYEMRQMWDAWVEQMPWGRTMRDIEQSCNVDESILLHVYKTKIYPQRGELLSTLQRYTSSTETNNYSKLKSTPRAAVLLSNLLMASALLDKNGTACVNAPTMQSYFNDEQPSDTRPFKRARAY